MLDTVCGTCGTPVSQARSGQWIHVDDLPEKTEEHDVDTVISRRDYLFGETERQEEEQAPRDILVLAEVRQADALERIASALERLANPFK